MRLGSPISEGRASPLGAHFDGGGVNFAVFSRHATRMTLCLFDDEGQETRIDLPERDGDVWHGYLSGVLPGQLYGYRAHGPYLPDEGHRFNPNKLLLDPYARQLTAHPDWHESLMGYTLGSLCGDLSFDKVDSAPYQARCVVTNPPEDWPWDKSPDTPMADTVIYEAHTRGLTAGHPSIVSPSPFRALASDPILDHLNKLGVTAIELLPVQSFLNDQFLVEKGLVNYWGYQTLGFFSPDPRFMGPGGLADFRQMVARFHSAGIEVILDVVYNHTCEGNEWGPTLSFRGLDNLSYYRLAENKRHYINDTGTGNTLNIEDPMVLRMVMDSLRYWAEHMHVDGFRFDLAATLGREAQGFDQQSAFFNAIRQDPVLTRLKLIAEPWDIGPGGYQLGAFPPPFSEWNDKFRDGVRRYWRGDPGRVPDLAQRITGSALQFDHSGRPATSSVNFLTAHDGFTLHDTVSYRSKHNEANGEDNRDGHSENYSDNFGVEGPTDDAHIIAARKRRKRNMLATLMLSQGTPMILAGDELGNSQGGNNNAYAQDNETGWVNWEDMDEDLFDFTCRLTAFRREHKILRQKRFLHARERIIDSKEDLFWWSAEGKPLERADWDDPSRSLLCVEMRTASGTPFYQASTDAIFMVFNSGDEAKVTLPLGPGDRRWRRSLDTWDPEADAKVVPGAEVWVAAESVVVFTLDPAK